MFVSERGGGTGGLPLSSLLYLNNMVSKKEKEKKKKLLHGPGDVICLLGRCQFEPVIVLYICSLFVNKH